VKNCRVFSIIANRFTVFDGENSFVCTIKGKVKKFKKIMVGDYVSVNEENTIDDIFERKNSLIRPTISNVDYGVVVASIEEPKVSKHLILKFLTYLNYNHIEPIVLFTKSDLKKDDLTDKFQKELSSAGILSFITSKNNAESFLNFINSQKNKTFLFFGQTGVGKSSIINLFDIEKKRLIGEYSQSLNRGKHQTKETIIIKVGDNFIADSPGFSSLDLNISKYIFRDYFPIISSYQDKCFFNDCKHLNEPKCAVKEDVKIGVIPEDWYNIYVTLMEESDE
jgi:ribosome biogenesis GTPase